MANSVFIIVELLFLVVTHVFGGPPWTVIGVIAILAQMLGGVRIASLVLMVPSLAWLALSHATGNRELFFPYTMYLASCVALRTAGRTTWRGPVAGGVVVAVFMVIRILQQATVRVLAVELVVAAAILALVVAAGSWRRRDASALPWHAAIVMTSSLVAYASLAL